MSSSNLPTMEEIVEVIKSEGSVEDAEIATIAYDIWQGLGDLTHPTFLLPTCFDCGESDQKKIRHYKVTDDFEIFWYCDDHRPES